MLVLPRVFERKIPLPPFLWPRVMSWFGVLGKCFWTSSFSSSTSLFGCGFGVGVWSSIFFHLELVLIKVMSLCFRSQNLRTTTCGGKCNSVLECSWVLCAKFDISCFEINVLSLHWCFVIFLAYFVDYMLAGFSENFLPLNWVLCVIIACFIHMFACWKFG